MFTAVHHLEEGSFAQRFYREVLVNIFSYAIVVSVGYALVYQRRLETSRLGTLELQRELAQARLDVLARTLQPHFLFNALNTVTALVRLNENRRALTAVVALSDLLRIVLKTRGELRIPLREELEFTERYCAVEQLRFEDRLAVEGDISPKRAAARAGAHPAAPGRKCDSTRGRGQRPRPGDHRGHRHARVAADVRARAQLWRGRRAAGGRIRHRTRCDSTRPVYLYGQERFSLELLVDAGIHGKPAYPARGNDLCPSRSGRSSPMASRWRDASCARYSNATRRSCSWPRPAPASTRAAR